MRILIGWLLINHISVPVIPERICVKTQELSQDRNIPVTEEAELYEAPGFVWKVRKNT
jgi:hypothetical protein